MAIIFKAHFDGKNIVPDEPVDLPVDEIIELEFRREPTHLPWDPDTAREAWERLKSRRVSGTRIPDEALRRENMYGDEGR
jgi:hypothetical protein